MMTNSQSINHNTSLFAITGNQLQDTVKNLPLITNTARMAIVIATLIFRLVLQNNGSPQPHFLTVWLFYLWDLVYFIAVIVLTIFPSWQVSESSLPSAVGMFDILMMNLLMALSGGLPSGFGILILPFVATSCLMNRGKNGLAYASFATLLIFGNAFYYTVANHNNFVFGSLYDVSMDINLSFQSGLLSASCFLVASLGSIISRNMHRAIHTMKQNEIEIARLNRLNELVLNQSQEGIIVVDDKGNVCLFNRHACYFFPDIKQAIALKDLVPIVRRWQNKVHYPFEDKANFSGNPVHVRAVPLVKQQPLLLIIFIRSLSDVMAESHSAKLAALGQLTANLAHEIRNPLSAISHANELLLESPSDDVDMHLKQIIQHNVERINRMIQEIMSLNRRDKTERVAICMREYIGQFITEFMLANPSSVGCLKLRIERKNHKIFVDEGHLHQILWNLLSNAWKFSNKDSQAVYITICTDKENTQELLISFCNNGIQVSEEIETRIFEPFFTTSSEGTGLGLFVARELAQANGGDLRYRRDTHSFELMLRMDK